MAITETTEYLLQIDDHELALAVLQNESPLAAPEVEPIQSGSNDTAAVRLKVFEALNAVGAKVNGEVGLWITFETSEEKAKWIKEKLKDLPLSMNPHSRAKPLQPWNKEDREIPFGD